MHTEFSNPKPPRESFLKAVNLSCWTFLWIRHYLHPCLQCFGVCHHRPGRAPCRSHPPDWSGGPVTGGNLPPGNKLASLPATTGKLTKVRPVICGSICVICWPEHNRYKTTNLLGHLFHWLPLLTLFACSLAIAAAQARPCWQLPSQWTLPHEIGQLTRLQGLWLRGSLLSSLPDEVGCGSLMRYSFQPRCSGGTASKVIYLKTKAVSLAASHFCWVG